MLTFNLKKKFYEMIVNGEKTAEYRVLKHYWSIRLNKLKHGDTIKFVNGYTNDFVIAEFDSLNIINYKELPKYAKHEFPDDTSMWYEIKFKIKDKSMSM